MKLALFLLLATATAHADIWQQAVEHRNDVKDLFAEHLQRGDDLVTSASVRAASLSSVRHNIDAAIAEYKAAGDLHPSDGEPYYRIGSVLQLFFVDCTRSQLPICDALTLNSNRATEVVAAYDEFERRAPMDPRVTEVLFERALLRTKLVSSVASGSKAAVALLEGAAADYKKLLERRDAINGSQPFIVVGNLAETYMMLGKAEEAVPLYQEAVRLGGSISTRYGLAVALDRDDRGDEALATIRDQGATAQQAFVHEFQAREIFFVPPGEEFYYFALAAEAFDQNAAAITYWNAYLRSGAHPEYQPRAKEHIAALRKKPAQPIQPSLDE